MMIFYFISIFLLINFHITSTKVLRNIINDFEGDHKKATEFWPSFDEEPMKILITTTPIKTLLSTIDNKDNNLINSFINKTESISINATTYNKFESNSTIINTSTVLSTTKPKEQNHFPKSDDSQGNQYYQKYRQYDNSMNYSRGIMYNIIIVVLGTIGVACFMAIIFGCIVIGRVSSPILCMGQKTNNLENNDNNQNVNNNNNNNNNQNINDNINNFSSANTIVSYLDNKRDIAYNNNSLPQITKSVSEANLVDPIVSKNDESIIYSTTSITDTSETKTISKLCNSGILTINNNFDNNVSPYAAVNIDDIKISANFKLNNYNKEMDHILNEDKIIDENNGNLCNKLQKLDTQDGTEYNNFNNTENNAIIIPVISKSISIISVSNRDNSTSEQTTLPSSTFDTNMIKNLSNNAFSSTNTIANTSTFNSNSTFYSYRVDKPLKQNMKMSSYRIQTYNNSLQELQGKTHQ